MAIVGAGRRLVTELVVIMASASQVMYAFFVAALVVALATGRSAGMSIAVMGHSPRRRMLPTTVAAPDPRVHHPCRVVRLPVGAYLDQLHAERLDLDEQVVQGDR